MRPAILIVEDEHDLVEVMRYNLEREGMAVAWAATGEEGVESARASRPDLMLLDIMLPGRDGLEVCRELKGSPETKGIPIIIVSAKGEEADVVVGLELGADDYVTKPFSPRVLVARVRALLRRSEQWVGGAQAPERDERIEVGGLTIDRARYDAFAPEGALGLTKTEFELLDFMARHGQRVFTRNHLLDAVRGEDVFVTDRTIDVHVAALRKKLGSRAARIATVRGIGYRFVDEG